MSVARENREIQMNPWQLQVDIQAIREPRQPLILVSVCAASPLTSYSNVNLATSAAIVGRSGFLAVRGPEDAMAGSLSCSSSPWCALLLCLYIYALNRGSLSAWPH